MTPEQIRACAGALQFAAKNVHTNRYYDAVELTVEFESHGGSPQGALSGMDNAVLSVVRQIKALAKQFEEIGV